MGYSLCFGIIKKEDTGFLQNATLDEIKTHFKDKVDSDGDLYFRDILSDIFDFGKGIDSDLVRRIVKHGSKLFKKEETKRKFDDYNAYLIDKEAIKEAIDYYSEKIIAYIQKLHDEANIEDMKEYFHDTLFFRRHKADLSDDPYSVADSWYYEDTIFNLVHVYKTIDWEKYSLIFYGH